MAITETHVVSGQIGLNPGTTVNILTSGQTIGLTPGNTVNIGSGSVQTSVSGNVVNISGQSVNIGNSPTVQTSVSGNVVQAFNMIGSQIIAGTIIVPSNSGGVQLPSNPLNVGLIFSDPLFVELSGQGSQSLNVILLGGLGNNAPYADTTIFPPYNGFFIDQLPVQGGPLQTTIGVNNTNQVRVVATSGYSGVALRYTGW